MSSATLLARAVERQNRTWAAMQDIQARADGDNRDLTAEERAAWDAAEAELDEASRDIERFERHARLDAVDRDGILPTSRGGTGGTDVERYAAAFANYLRRGMARLNSEEQRLLEEGFTELRDQGTQTDVAGGYLVPEGYRNRMVEVMKAYGGLVNLAENITTDTGQDLPWVQNDDTGNEGEILGENKPVTQQDVAFTGRKLKAHIFSSKMVRLPLTLLQDSAFDLETWLPGKLGERIGRRAARAFISGSGVDEPQGITTGVIVGRTGANGQTTSIIYDDLLDLEHSVDVAYRTPECQFLLHDTSLKVIRKLKDSQNRPIWLPVPTAGMPATINGWAYKVDNNMPVMAANALSILFGNFRQAYVVRTVRGISQVRLAERYAEFMQVAFFAWSRMDGMVQDPNAVRAYANSAT